MATSAGLANLAAEPEPSLLPLLPDVPANVTTVSGVVTTRVACDVVAVLFELVITQRNESPFIAATTELTVSVAVAVPV